MTQKDKDILWKKYINNPSRELRDKLIIEYSPLVKVVAGRMSMYLYNYVDQDDLESYGVFGLIDAIDKFSLTKGVKFETYASLRIRGEILDNLRRMDWVPRSLRDKQKKITDVKSKLYQKYNREPSEEEISNELGVSKEEYTETLRQIDATNLVYLDDSSDNNSEGINKLETLKQSTFDIPEQSVMKESLKEKLKEALELLTEKEKKVILLYYYEELTIREIAVILEVSESRVSQVHAKALSKMKSTMADFSDLFYNLA